MTPEQLKAISLEDAMREIAVKVYEATQIIEDLERAGKVSGNGHHARQKLAQMCADELKFRWRWEE